MLRAHTVADNKPDDPQTQLVQDVGRRAERKEKARREGRHGIWFGLGMFGLIGWAVAIPTLLGIALGLWLDARWPQHFSWTLSLLFVGIILGCLNAWRWVQREGRHDR